MDVIGKITILALLTCVTASVLKQTTPEGGVILTCAAVVVAAGILIAPMQSYMQDIRDVLERCGLPQGMIKPLFKTIGIALCVRIGSGIFQDAGSSAMSVTLEIAGAVCEIIAAMPILQAVLQLLEDYL